MRAGIVVNVTLEDRLRPQAIVSDRNAPQKHVWRAKIILATADDCGTEVDIEHQMKLVLHDWDLYRAGKGK